MTPMAIIVLLVAVLAVPRTSADLPRLEHPSKAPGSLTVLAVGDWGRGGQFNQTLVARQV